MNPTHVKVSVGLAGEAYSRHAQGAGRRGSDSPARLNCRTLVGFYREVDLCYMFQTKPHFTPHERCTLSVDEDLDDKLHNCCRK